MRTRIKICGITSPAIAEAAVAAGSDAIGLIFHPPSKRHLQLDQAAAICDSISHAAGSIKGSTANANSAPFVTTVAVMVNPSADYVQEIIDQVNPSCLQFHGEELAEFCMAFHKPYIKAVRVTPDTDLPKLEAQYASAQGFLLDTAVEGQYGGSGITFDWKQANYANTVPIILAGGLTAENIAEAITQVSPYAVDISTGVETNGQKDVEKIRQFCQTVIRLSH